MRFGIRHRLAAVPRRTTLLALALGLLMAFSAALPAAMARMETPRSPHLHALAAYDAAGGQRLLRYTPPGAAGESRPASQAGKTPLILLHGITPTSAGYYGWQRFVETVAEDPQIQSRYTLYFFAYNPSLPRAKVSEAFRKTLARWTADHPEAPPVRLLALSLGGLLARDALLDPALEPRIERVITIGTPFHGTPLANPSWMRQQFRQEPPLSTLRLSNRLVYSIVKKKFPHFERDYCWDNFDGSLPARLSGQSPCPRALSDTAILTRVSDKLITYGSYFAPGEAALAALGDFLGGDPSAANLADDRPRLVSNAPRLVLDKHKMMAMVAGNIGQLPEYTHWDSDVATGETAALEEDETLPSMMGLNDGVCPISSHLWLGRYVNRQAGFTPLEIRLQLWSTLKKLQGTGQARLFAEMDHRDWMEGTTRSGGTRVRDLLNPDEPPKTVFDWLRQDLLQAP